jgi:hypothetical membrane protein
MPPASGSTPPQTRHWPLLLAGVAGIAVPVAMSVAFVVGTLTRPAFNPLTEAASRLGERGSPHALLFNTVHFYVAGLLLIGFAVGLYIALERAPGGKLAAGLVALGGMALTLSGFFTLDPTSTDASAIHDRLAIPFFVGMPCAALVIGLALRTASSGAVLPSVSTGIGILLLVLVVTFIARMDTIPDGLFQRLYLAAFHVWLIVLGVWLMRLSRHDEVVGSTP